MRIFYAANTTPTANFASRLWRENLFASLVELGHDVVEFDYDLRPIFENLDPAIPEQRAYIATARPKTGRELLAQIAAAHAVRPIDMFFSYFYDACVAAEVIDAIRAMGILTVNFYCNASFQLHLVAGIAPHYDWCLVPESFRLDDYRALGARPIRCQMAATPRLYRPVEGLAPEFDVTFVGQAYGERPEWVDYLRGRGFDVRVWGPGWADFRIGNGAPSPGARLSRGLSRARRLFRPGGLRAAASRVRTALGGTPERPRTIPPPSVTLPAEAVGGFLSDEEMIRMYSRSRINLGFSSCGDPRILDQRILQVRLRDFEVPMSGGFYMVERMDELEEFYEIGKEVVCYTGREDLAEKIAYYLEHEDEREAIRLAGHRRALRDHTWKRRFEEAFRTIGAPTHQRV